MRSNLVLIIVLSAGVLLIAVAAYFLFDLPFWFALSLAIVGFFVNRPVLIFMQTVNDHLWPKQPFFKSEKC